MNAKDFNKLADAAKMKSNATREACRLVLVGGKSRHEAADDQGINVSVVSRGVKKLSREICECCKNFK